MAFRILLAGVLVVAGGVLAKAQYTEAGEPAVPPAYLLMQGPSAKKSKRFLPGERIDVRFRGEDEFFPLRLNELYPDAQAALLGENLIQLSDIAAVRIPNRHGLKNYVRIQGIVNFVVMGLAALADREVRETQRGLIAVAGSISGAMVLYGSLDRYKTRDVGAGGRYVLAVGGGVKPIDRAPERPRRY